MKKLPRVILMIDTGRSPGRAIIRGITKYAQLYGPWIFFQELSYYRLIHSWSGSSVYNAQGRRMLTKLLRSSQADGFLADIPNTSVAKSIIPEDFPAVLIPGREFIDGYINMSCDNENAGVMAAEYFMALGFTNFGFCGYTQNYWSRMRCESYRMWLMTSDNHSYLRRQL